LKIVCISDTHNIAHPKELPDGDVLIHAGDLTLGGEIHEVQHALAWFRRFPHKYKIFIGGNHDNALFRMPGIFDICQEQMKSYKDCSAPIYLQDSFVDIEGLRIFGSPTTEYKSLYRIGARAFMKTPHQLERHWRLAPACDILVTHGPPKGFRDTIHEGYMKDGKVQDRTFQCGDEELRNYAMRIKPKLHIFGHIHHQYGVQDFEDTKFINAALLNDQYRAVNEPIVVEV
jgi:Icc-related predicted phosphoesterase